MLLQRMILSVLMLFSIAFTASAQSYDDLWVQVDTFARRDLPRDEMNVLNSIIGKAAKEKKYGQLVAAERQLYIVKRTLMPDSVSSMRKELRAAAKEAGGKNPVLSAVYYCVLNEADSALKNKDILAKAKDSDYSPLVSVGVSSDIFNHDLLHVVGIYLNRYDELSKYYSDHGNRRAALVTAALGTSDVKVLDSLASTYSDLAESVFVMGRRAQLTSSPEDSWNYTNAALKAHEDSKYANILRNQLTRLQQSRFEARLQKTLINSSDSVVLNITNMVNTRSIKVGLRKFGDVKEIAGYTFDIPVTKTYIPKDTTLLMSPVPIGKYEVLVYRTDTTSLSYALPLNVSDLSLMITDEPDWKHYHAIVLDSYTGHPHGGATVRKSSSDNDSDSKEQWQTDKNGEVSLPRDNGSVEFQAYTPNDTLSAFTRPGNYYASKTSGEEYYAQAMTDRAIYRPGQTVHVAATAYKKKNEHPSVVPNLDLGFLLYNASNDEVDTVVAKTDAYGTATADFVIPKHALTGVWSINVTSCKDDYIDDVPDDYEDKYEIDEDIRFSVEEYKRPTFYVSLDKPTETYSVGDTILLTGKAMSYTGLPLKGATVTTDVRRGPWSSAYNGDLLSADTLTTDNNGEFAIRMPISLPDDAANSSAYWGYYMGNIVAQVTDAAGESQKAFLSIPMSRHKTRLKINLINDATTDKLQVCFQLTNLAWKPVDGTIHYGIKDKKNLTFAVPANDTITIDVKKLGLQSGVYDLFATYDNDTVSAEFSYIDFTATRLSEPRPIFLAAERKEFQSSDDKIRVQMGTSLKDVYVIYEVYANNKIIESRREIWNDELITRTFKYKDSYGAGLLVSIAWIKDGELFSKSVFLGKPKQSKELSVKWKTFRDKLIPGQTETWTMNIVRPDGKPADAQLSATMFDSSLDLFRVYLIKYSEGLFADKSSAEVFWNVSRSPYRATGNYAFIRKPEDFLPERSLYFSHFISSLMHGYNNEKSLTRLYYQPLADKVKGTQGWITGLVVDDVNEGIIGATVKDSQTGTYAISDLDGMFSIATSQPATLEVSYVGYTTQMVTASPGEFIVITLREDRENLNEVEVVGYGVRNKGNLTEALQGRAMSVNSLSSLGISSSDGEEAGIVPVVTPRSNFNETALWAPRLYTNSKGDVDITFTLPESLTSWKLGYFAHDKQMNYAIGSASAIARKELMVQPNIPRFIRRGDKAVVSTRIINLSKAVKNGTVKLEVVNPEKDSVVYETTKNFSAAADSTLAVPFEINLGKDGGLNSVIPDLSVLRITALCDDGSGDGEQNYLAILPQHEPVINTVAATLEPGKTLNVDIDKLFGNKAENRSLTVNYVRNPMWFVVEALGNIMQTTGTSSTDIMCNLYSTALASYIIENNKDVKAALQNWIQNDTSSSSFTDDESLRTIINDEMPWTSLAQSESLTKERLSTLLDKDAVEGKLNDLERSLRQLQKANGSFSWFPGMSGSMYTTLAVTQPLVKLQKLTGEDYASELTGPAIKYLYNELASRIKAASLNDKVRSRRNTIRYYDTDYQILYTLELAGYKDSLGLANHIINDALAHPADLTIYGKAVMATVLANHGNMAKAREFLESIRQYSVRTPMMGIYFDTDKAQYTWRDYKIPTVTAAIGAFSRIEPEDTVMVRGMKQWLIEEKRTQVWDTPLNSMDAIWGCGLSPTLSKEDLYPTLSKEDLYPTLSKGEGGYKMTCGSEADGDNKTFGSEALNHNMSETGEIVEQKRFEGDEIPHSMTFENKGNENQWVNIFAQSVAPINEADDPSSNADDNSSNADKTSSNVGNAWSAGSAIGQGFSIRLEIIPAGELYVGDKIKVKITIHADRDYDCVSVSDNRAACLEPTVQTSGYDWRTGCYTAIHDTRTDYFFDKMAKGDYVIEQECFIDRPGTYNAGSCTIQCAFAPAFMARTTSEPLIVFPSNK